MPTTATIATAVQGRSRINLPVSRETRSTVSVTLDCTSLNLSAASERRSETAEEMRFSVFIIVVVPPSRRLLLASLPRPSNITAVGKPPKQNPRTAALQSRSSDDYRGALPLLAASPCLERAAALESRGL